ncbi:hypothetical protein EZS27_031866, partial [termite gut metagenome]
MCGGSIIMKKDPIRVSIVMVKLLCRLGGIVSILQKTN